MLGWSTSFTRSLIHSFTLLLRRQKEAEWVHSSEPMRDSAPWRHVFSGMIDVHCPEDYSLQQARVRLSAGGKQISGAEP